MLTAPFVFAKYVEQTFASLCPQCGLLTFVDDILLCSKAWDHRLQLMEDMFKALMKAVLTLKPSKTQFGRLHVKYLRYVISRNGISIGHDRIKAMVDLTHPSNIKELRSVLGAFTFGRKFMKNIYADIVAPLVNLICRETAQQKSLTASWKLNTLKPSPR